MKVLVVVVLLSVVGLLGLTFELRPQEATFEQTEELRGRIAYQGRYSDARLSLRSVFSGANVLGGTNDGFAQLPNGTQVIARVARVRTLLGDMRVIVKATSEIDGRAVIDRSAAQCVQDWDRSTISVLIPAILTFVALCFGLRWIFSGQTSASSPRTPGLPGL